ncbi:hypothetical protein PEBR_28578 [Penicillium brasilianum]|uniref:Tachykinin family protein n=1 Tax=Penicillium brasilianum TaxID=104259 RepID=A0A1S9RHV0_PENBI|nr:hypothetical protein PEBR_28578 [Penicillium brasilianum]
MPPQGTTEKPLLFIDGLNKPEVDKRKQIRKYVMLGKNRGKTRNTRPASTDEPHTEPVHPDLVVKMHYPAVPNKVGDELSFTQFAAPLAPQLTRDILKFSLMAKKVMYPLEPCIEFHRKDKVDTFYFDLMTYDATYLHAVAFSCQAFFNKASPRQTAELTRRSVIHHSAALKLLRERLSIQGKQIKYSDSTILVILSLARHAHLTGNFDTAKQHMEGLRRIVDFRGGLVALGYNSKLVMEIMKCDLGIALFGGTEPFFFRDPSLEPMIPYELGSLTVQSPDTQESQYWTPALWDVNDDLIRAWTVMGRFCSTINSATNRSRRLPKEILLNTMGSVMYRLLDMKGFDPTSLNEAIRLGLLAFTSHTFLHFQNMKPPQTKFHQKYQDCLRNIKWSAKAASIILWLLTIGAISVFKPTDDPWLMPLLRDQMRYCGISEWEDFHRHMKRFLWIKILHDESGERVLNTAALEQ